jgi:hypothetical protein
MIILILFTTIFFDSSYKLNCHSTVPPHHLDAGATAGSQSIAQHAAAILTRLHTVQHLLSTP